MKIETSSHIMLKVSILSIAMLSMGVAVVSPALADISRAFPDKSEDTIKLVLSVPYFLIIIFTLLGGKLSQYFSKKRIVLTGVALFTLGGILPAFSQSFAFLMSMRVVLGIGLGLFNPFTSGLITDFFGQDEKAKMLGYQGVAVNIGNIATTFLAGLVCMLSWNYTFYVYGIGIIVFFLVLVFLPEQECEICSSHEKKQMDKRVYYYSGAMFIYVALIFSIYTNISFFMQSNNLGNSAAAGTAITMMTIGALIVSLTFGWIFKFFGEFTIIVSIALTGIGLLVLAVAQSIGVVFLGTAIAGFGFGIINPVFVYKITGMVPKTLATFAISILFSVFNLGSFVSPFVLMIIEKIFASSSSRLAFLVCGAGVMAEAAILLWSVITNRRKTALRLRTDD